MPLAFAGPATRITRADIAAAAASVGLPYADLAAVCAVEASGRGFLPDGRPKILCEALHFHNHTGGKYDESHPKVSSPVWNRALYAHSGEGEWLRMGEMLALDRQAALLSASWGLFQIMGENYRAAGYPTVEAFVAAMCTTEAEHLRACLGFLRTNHLVDMLKRGDVDGFCRGYNGPRFREDGYPDKFRRARAAAAAEPAPTPAVQVAATEVVQATPPV